MKIRFNVKQSRFVAPCEKAIKSGMRDARLGRLVELAFKAPRDGYTGDVRVTIDGNNRDKFEAEWERDESRFPARIKAAATALRNLGCFGRFAVFHSAGSLRISPA
ncbi:MAG TPA: hypothetical protein VGY66_29630 [Gemmataceae bacterium]|jgi:hypothetical protein|nr:hypothetical protein [Gemmataceae bacterium]